MKILFLWRYYPDYVSHFYRKCPEAIGAEYDQHRNILFSDHFGWPAELSQYLSNMGIDTQFLVGNDELMQRKWAAENDYVPHNEASWEHEIALEQIRRYRPDVLFTSCICYHGVFVKQALKYAKKAVTWVGSPYYQKLDVSGFSSLLTENPVTLKDKHHRFERIFVTKPGFDPAVLEAIGNVERRKRIVFSGSISREHAKRVGLLAYLLENGVDVDVFGRSDTEVLPGKLHGTRLAIWHALKSRDLASSARTFRRAWWPSDFEKSADRILSVANEPVYGVDMYRLYAGSFLALNIHGDVAGNNAGNMRMFEATGVGSCLVTEHSENISDIFEPGVEIVTYKTKEELLEILRHAQSDRSFCRTIGTKGQERTLRSHTLARMWGDISPAFDMR